LNLLTYLTEPAWGRSREFDITTHTVRKGNASAGDFGDEEEDEDSSFAQSSKKNMIAFMPAQGKDHPDSWFCLDILLLSKVV
jgi:chaperone BCS1